MSVKDLNLDIDSIWCEVIKETAERSKHLIFTKEDRDYD